MKNLQSESYGCRDIKAVSFILLFIFELNIPYRAFAMYVGNKYLLMDDSLPDIYCWIQ